MTDQLKQLHQKTSIITGNATSSQASVDGLGRLNSQDGIQLDLFGQQASPANRFRALDSKEEKKTSDTSGPSSLSWLKSADLQLSLESKLRQRMGENGSVEYKLTWKRWDIPARPPICRLQASVRHTKGTDYSGAPWATASARDWKDTVGMATKGVNPDGSIRKRLDQLPRQAQLVGWPTTQARDWKGPQGRAYKGKAIDLPAVVSGLTPPSSPAPMEDGEGCLAGWETPAQQEPGITVERLVDKHGNPWTPGKRAYDKETGRLAQTGLTQMDHSVSSNTNLKLNPYFSLWLMGYPIEWGYCGARVTR